MPDVRPFRGVRYDVAQVGALSDVVAPPYDVIDPALQERLYEASPYNIIRLELSRAGQSDTETDNRYTRAAGFLRTWMRQGILCGDDHPSLYLYEQTFEVEGQTHSRKGYFARVRLEPFGQGKVFPHEQTLAGPKADRLALYQSTGFNLSPIFGLYPDVAQEVLRTVEAGLRDRTPLVATDHLGVVNRLWVVTDPGVHTAVQGLMADRPIFIADGHHRYETGLKYRDLLAQSGVTSDIDDPANFCMMMLVGMTDPGLLILPTHRLVSGLEGLTGDELARRLEHEFEVRRMGHGSKGCRLTWEAISQSSGQDSLGFGTVADDSWLLARLRSDETMDRLAADHSAEWRSLGVSILHVLVLGHLLAGHGSETAKTDASSSFPCRYVHLTSEVLDTIAARGCDLACLVPPARMEHVEAIASSLETMPPKSTYFYPKLLTGMVLNPLR
jgi:uncharacterized protein (DUF1015 family)